MFGEYRSPAGRSKVVAEIVVATMIVLIVVTMVVMVMVRDYSDRKDCERRGGHPVYTERQIVCFDDHVLK